MNENQHFDKKWDEAQALSKQQEFSLYVKMGDQPRTQRQFNLWWYYRMIDDYIKGYGFSSSLELGAGRGTISLYLKKNEEFDVTLNDASESAIALARKNFALFEEDAQFQVGDASALPFADNSFDVVTSIGLMEHLDNYTPILAEAYRVCKPGGVMIQINIPQKKSIQILNVWYRKVLSFFGVPLNPDFPRNHDKPEQYAEHARAVGFINVETINVNPFPLFVPVPRIVDRMLARLYRLIMRVRSICKKQPFITSYGLSQCHFLMGWKKNS